MRYFAKARWTLLICAFLLLLAGLCCVQLAYAEDAVVETDTEIEDTVVAADAAVNATANTTNAKSAAYYPDGRAYHGEGHALGLNYDQYPTFEGATDEYGFHILTSEARGCQLKNGYAYRVTSRLSFDVSANTYMAALVANNNLIYIDENVIFDLYGSNGGGIYPGLPAIALYEGKNLYLAGDGKIRAFGGNAGAGSNGENASSAYESGSFLRSGNGGRGGSGGGGAGAGIGTAGGVGGQGSWGGDQVSAHMKRHADDYSGKSGTFDTTMSSPGKISNPGQLCISGNVMVYAYGGKSAPSGRGGNAAAFYKTTTSWITKHLSGGSGGGGGGGGGADANGYGKGGEGGVGGAGGGSAGSMWRTRPSSDDPPSAGGGQGGTSVISGAGGQGGGTVRNIKGCIGGSGGLVNNYYPKGSAYTTDSWDFPVMEFRANHLNVMLPVAKRIKNPFSPSKNPFIKTSDFEAQVRAVSSYAAYESIPENGAWLKKNNMFADNGQAGSNRAFYTIASVTTSAEIRNALAGYTPTKEGYTFLGWKIDGDTSNTLIYDQQNKSLNTSHLRNLKLLGNMGKSGEVWVGQTAISVVAVWQKNVPPQPETYSIVFHKNGGTFCDKNGNAVAGMESYTLTGIVQGSKVTLWNGTSLLNGYFLKPPNGLDPKSPVLSWSLKGDGTGYAEGTVFKHSVELDNLNPNKLKQIDLYAVWKDG